MSVGLNFDDNLEGLLIMINEDNDVTYERDK